MSFQNIRFYSIQPSAYGAWGDTFRVQAIVEHQGPEEVATFHTAIGHLTEEGFEEIISGEQDFTFPEYYEAAGIGAEPGWKAYSPWCDVGIGTTIPVGTYDILVSINGVSVTSLHSAVIIGEQGLEFQDFLVTIPEALQVTAHTLINTPVSFSYRVGEDVTVNLLAYIYIWEDGVTIPLLLNSKTILLQQSLDWKDWEETCPVEIIPTAEGGIGNGTYGLGVMIEGYSEQAQYNIDSCIVVSGIQTPIANTITPLITLGVLGAVMVPMFKGVKEKE